MLPPKYFTFRPKPESILCYTFCCPPKRKALPLGGGMPCAARTFLYSPMVNSDRAACRNFKERSLQFCKAPKLAILRLYLCLMSNTIKWRLAQRLEIKWWKRYLKYKDVDTYLDWKRNYWMTFLDSIDLDLTKLEDKKVLDAGCGPAGIFTLLRSASVTAVDPLIDQYEMKLEHFDCAKYPGVHFITSSLEHYSPEESYDYVFCLNVINHVADIDRALDNLFGVMTPGGYLILSIDCHKYKYLKHLFRWLPGDALHPHQYDLTDYRKMVERRGGAILKDVLSKGGNIFDYRVLVITKRK